MKKIYVLIVITSLISSCNSSKKAVSKNKLPTVIVAAGEKKEEEKANRSEKVVLKKANEIVNTALTFKGTPYKYGGVTKKGMDCSGLIYTSFKKHDVALQRTSLSMSSQGEKIALENAQKGDLLFFNTNKNKRKINHVGLIVSVDNNSIKFIHSTSSRGVLVSSLKEGYWKYAFIEIRRIL